MKLQKISLLAAGLMIAAAQVRAGWYGNLGKTLDKGHTAVGAVVDIGGRDLEAENNSGDGDVDITGLTVRVTHGLGAGVEVYGRIAPMTMKWEADDIPGFEPNLLTLGGGLQWAPEGQRGPLTFGVGAGFDWGQGDDNDIDLELMEFSLAGGVGYAVDKNLDIYGGLSLLNTDVTLETGGTDFDYEAEDPIGLFAGVNYSLNRNIALGAELRLINEQVISLVGRYTFGGKR